MGELAAYLAIGTAVGFFAGLLGIGGGVIIVSSLALMFSARGFPAQFVMHYAIGTSLATIIVGSWASFRAHHRRGAVDWAVVKAMVPGMLAGVVVGAAGARFVSTSWLKVLWLVFLVILISQMAFNLRPQAGRDLPGRTGLTAMAVFIGVCSSLLGGGAAAFGVPFLTWCRMTIHRAIGTAAALGFPLAIAGTVGYAVAGWSVPDAPRWSVGFVYLPAFLGLALTSVLLAPLGARVAHRLGGVALRRIFALFLLAVGLKVAISV